jgi:hypothetical protein
MLKKVISGGQTGADIAGVYTAKRFGLETGGWMPKGFMTQAGPRPKMAQMYGFKEHDSPRYPPRTAQNVKESDATLRFAVDFQSSGELCTLRAINQHKKPSLDIDLRPDAKTKSPKEVIDWLERYKVVVLNIAGNSERTHDGMTGEVIEYLTRLFIEMGLKELPPEETA